MNIQEACNYLNISKDYMMDLLNSGVIPYKQDINLNIFISVSNINIYKEERDKKRI